MKPKTKQEGAKYAGFVMMGRNCNCFDEAFKRNPAYDGPKYSPALSYAVFMHLAMAAKTEPTDDRLNKKITSTVRCEAMQGLTSYQTLTDLFNVPKNQIELAIIRLVDMGLIKWEPCKDMPNVNLLNGSRYTILKFMGEKNQPFTSDRNSDVINNKKKKTGHGALTKDACYEYAEQLANDERNNWLKGVDVPYVIETFLAWSEDNVRSNWKTTLLRFLKNEATNPTSSAFTKPKAVKATGKATAKVTGMDAAFAMDEQYNKPRKVA